MKPTSLQNLSPELEKALTKALRMLNASDKLTAEIRKALLQAGHDENTVEQAIQLLTERRALDDRRTVAALVEKAVQRKGQGIEHIRAELILRGAPEEIVSECLSQQDPGDERELALKALQSQPRKDTRAKAGRFLAARGFSEEAIELVLEDLYPGGHAD